MQYHDLRAFVEKNLASGHRGRLDNNTYGVKISETEYGIKLHDTVILTYDESGTITFNTGGWQTSTTRDRMCKFTGVRMHQEKNTWFVHLGKDRSVIFHTGLKIRRNNKGEWNMIDPGWILVGINDTEESIRNIKRSVGRYIDGFIDALMQGKVTEPGMGDCFICLAEASEKKFNNHDHILSHMDEMYYVPTLAVAAIRFAGQEEKMVSWFYQKCRSTEPIAFWDGVYVPTLKKALRKLLYHYVKIAKG